MGGYWQSVLWDAWQNTVRPLQWSKERFVTTAVLIAATVIGGGVAALTQLASTNAALIIGIAFVAICLFVIGVIQAQYKIHSKLVTATDTRISALEASVARLTSKKPNYTAARMQHEYSIGSASRLWADISPDLEPTIDSEEWFRTFVSAIQTGELNFKPESPYSEHEARREKERPTRHTVITREEFKRYAAAIHKSPLFLRNN